MKKSLMENFIFCAVLSENLLRSFEGILNGKLDGKIYFLWECWSIKLIVFMEPRIAEKIILIFALVF